MSKFFRIAVSPHMCSLLLPGNYGKHNEKRRKMKRRNASSHYVAKSMMTIPVLEYVLNRDCRVIEKLKEEGWAEELENHPSTYEGLRNFTGVRVVKPLTDKGMSFARYLRHSLTTR